MVKIERSLLNQVIQARPQASHKGDYGRLLLLGGCYPYGGAILMAVKAAVYSGAGLVTVGTEAANITALHAQLPEAMAFAVTDRSLLEEQLAKAEVVLLGPGLGESDDACHLMESVLSSLSSAQVLILDGSALSVLSKHRERFASLISCQLVLTPHQMEWERLSQVPIAKQTPERSLRALGNFPKGTILVAKGPRTVVLQEGQLPRELTIGGPYQATGGMGDTLAGIIAGFIGQFKGELLDRVTAAVYTHSAIAEELSQSHYVTLPSQIAEKLPVFMHRILTEKEA
ncbi:NAD(P)H-hydrate dehydratase [Streptococcus rifensis]